MKSIIILFWCLLCLGSRAQKVITPPIKRNPIDTSVAQLRTIALPDANTIYQMRINNVVGEYIYDSTDNKSVDDSVMVVVSLSGKRLKRVVESNINIKWFGATGDGITDDTQAFLKAFRLLKNGVQNTNFTLYIPNGRYIISKTLATPAGAGHFIIRGDGEANTTLIWNGESDQDFIRLVNAWGVKLIDFAMWGKNGPKRPRRMINLYKTSTSGQDGAVQECLLQNLELAGQNGEFTDGITWTCSGPDQDANNEQTSVENCYVRSAKQFAISIEHANSLWHKIKGGGFSGDSAAINTIPGSGTVGGGFSIEGSALQVGNFPSGYCFRLGGSYYPYQITDVKSESTGRLLYARPNGYYYQVRMVGCSFKINSAEPIINAMADGMHNSIEIINSFIIGNGEKILLTGNSSANFTARNVYWNVSMLSYSWNVLFDAVNGVAPLTRTLLAGGHLNIINPAGDQITNWSDLAFSATPQLNGSKFYQITYNTPVVITDFLGGKTGDEFTLYTKYANVSLLNGYTFQSPFGYARLGDATNYTLPAMSITKFIKTSSSEGARWQVQPQISEDVTMSHVALKKSNHYDPKPLLTIEGNMTVDSILFTNGTKMGSATTGATVSNFHIVRDANFTIPDNAGVVLIASQTAARTLTLPSIQTFPANKILKIRNGSAIAINLSVPIRLTPDTTTTILIENEWYEIILAEGSWWVIGHGS